MLATPTSVPPPLPSPDAAGAGQSDSPLAKQEAKRLLALRSWLTAQLQRQETQREGGLPVDAFMQGVLYQPGLGYYHRAWSPIGPQGDFMTAPEVSGLFAQTLALELRRAMLSSDLRRVVEFGAGNGTLARQLLQAWRGFDTRARAQGTPLVGEVQYDIVDISAPLRARQRATLGEDAQRVRWLDELEEGAQALVIANEVLDALPVKLLRRKAGAWHEVLVTWAVRHAHAPPDPQAWPDEALRLVGRHTPLSPSQWEDANTAPSETLRQLDAPDGYLSEWHTGARAWVAMLGRRLVRGAVWLVDYGYTASEYFAPQRDRGSLCAHYRHHRVDDPLWRVGACDLTAHVDFTQVGLDAEAMGLEVGGFTSQARYLLNAGILDLMQHEATLIGPTRHDRHAPSSTSAPMRRQHAALRTLLDESDMGERFKVMLLARDMPSVAGQIAGVQGFVQGDRTHRL